VGGGVDDDMVVDKLGVDEGRRCLVVVGYAVDMAFVKSNDTQQDLMR